jgi:hypothetical protein
MVSLPFTTFIILSYHLYDSKEWVEVSTLWSLLKCHQIREFAFLILLTLAVFQSLR